MTALTHSGTDDVLAGGVNMGVQIRAHDWACTALGPMPAWPQALRCTVSICLGSHFPMLILWGPELVMIYNDALARLIGHKHPHALGQRAADGWQEVWPVLGPMLHSVLREGASTWSENQRLDLERTQQNDCLEEAYFTLACSPIRDESGGVGDTGGLSGIGGVFCVVTETTTQVLGERRLRTLGALAQQTAGVGTARDACVKAAGALQHNAADMPAVLIYLADDEGLTSTSGLAGLVAMAGLSTAAANKWPASQGGEWPLASVLESGLPVLVEVGAVQRAFELLDCQPTLPVASALLLPLGTVGKAHPAGVMVVGLAPQQLLDDDYRNFLMQAASHLGETVAVARALESADRRVELLAHDPAKTAFLSNVSHDFARPMQLERHPWEKVVLNLLSSLQGGAIGLAGADDRGSSFTASLPVGTTPHPKDPNAARRTADVSFADVDAAMAATSVSEKVARAITRFKPGPWRQTSETSQTRLYSLFEQAPAAIAILRGPTFVFDFVNLHYEALVQRRELTGKAVLAVWPEFAGQPLHRTLCSVFATGERYVGRDYLVRLKRGASQQLEDIYYDFVYDPYRSADGSVEGIMLVAFEVTQRVRSTLERERLLVERESISIEREELLNREREARAQAERALLAKDQFLAMLGHELRNPLAPIVTALDLLRANRPKGDLAGREYAVIDRQVKHLTALVDDLLDVSALTRGKIELRREAVEMSRLLDQALEIARPLLEQREHALTVEVARRGLMVDADATRMAQVLSNLLINAAKYTEPGGRIDVSARIQHGNVELTMTDNGIGIPATLLPLVFELFVQGGQAIDRSSGGLGLGLAIVRNLMVMHGGSVSAQSSGRDQGSTFTIALPWVERAADPVEVVATAPLPAARGSGLKILVVDDNTDAADTLARLLIGLGHEVRVAYDGVSTLALLELYQPRIAFLDIGLPSMDGYELARRLRLLFGLKNPYLVALTGYGQKSDVDRAMNAGFDQHLVKPLDFAKLVALLKFPVLQNP